HAREAEPAAACDVRGPALAVRHERRQLGAALVRHPEPTGHVQVPLEGLAVALDVVGEALQRPTDDVPQLPHPFPDGLQGEGRHGRARHTPPLPTPQPGPPYAIDPMVGRLDEGRFTGAVSGRPASGARPGAGVAVRATRLPSI